MEPAEDDDARGRGRTAALSRLVQAYSRPLARFFGRRVSAPAEVPDLVQDVFLRLSRMPDPEVMRQPDSFIFATAANVLKDRARRAATRLRATGPIDDLDIEGSDFTPDRVLEGRMAVRRLEQALAELPERTRDVFVLRVLEGWKMADIAETVGVSIRAAEKHQARALAHVTFRLADWRP